MLPVTGTDVGKYLSDGWEIAGYSVCMMAMGALTHNILLRKGTDLTTVTIGTNAGAEIGRAAHILSPVPEAPTRRGFFG